MENLKTSLNPFLSVFCDIWEREWSELNIDEKANFIAYINVGFFNKNIENLVVTRYNKERQQYFEMYQ